MKHGKKYVDSQKLIDRLTQYDPDQAISLVKQTAKVVNVNHALSCRLHFHNL